MFDSIAANLMPRANALNQERYIMRGLPAGSWVGTGYGAIDGDLVAAG